MLCKEQKIKTTIVCYKYKNTHTHTNKNVAILCNYLNLSLFLKVCLLQMNIISFFREYTYPLFVCNYCVLRKRICNGRHL